jgi:GH15 family glucan-1,4-alpha-glucosidase
VIARPLVSVDDLAAISVQLIRANQTANGAYVAAPTFPTYHYCWFRDGAFVAYSLDRAGDHASPARFYHWAIETVIGRADAIERVIAAPMGAYDQADLLDTRYTLDGRAGTEDWPNFQLDGFGTLLWGIAEHLRLSGQALPAASRPAVSLLARYLSALWRLPCYDCWEEFGNQIHTATLAAIYGGLRAAADLLGEPVYAAIAGELRAFVLDRCVHEGALRKFVGSQLVDASLLWCSVPFGLVAADDPLMCRTADLIRRTCVDADGGVHRYPQDSYYGGGAWLLLTAWLGWYEAQSGQIDLARQRLAWAMARADSQGSMPEQVAEHLIAPSYLPEWQERWGTSASPLLWSHAMYLVLAREVSAWPGM